MPGSPTKTSSRLAESPTRPSGSLLGVPKSTNGVAKRAATSPVKRTSSPLKRSPTKLDNVSVPEVREQARHVLENFLRRSLSQNDASRGYGVRKYYSKDGTDLSSIQEKRNSSEDDFPAEKRGSYHAAVSEDSSYRTDERSSSKNDERKHSTSSVTSLTGKSQSLSVTSAEKKKINDRLKRISKREGLGESLSPTDSEFKGFTPNSTSQSRGSEPKTEKETSDDEDTVQKGRRKKSKFSQAKSRIRDSFLRKQRELRSQQSEDSPKTPSEEILSKQHTVQRPVPKPATGGGIPVISRKSPTPEESKNGQAVPPRASTDFDEDESPSATFNNRNAVHANSSPDGLNRINQVEKKTRTSLWDWFRPNKRKKSKPKITQKSRSLDALSNPAYSVQNAKFGRLFSDEGPQTDSNQHRHPHHGKSLQKKHSFSLRCSFSGKTSGGVDRTTLKLSGLKVNKPRTPEPHDHKRIFASDVVTDGLVDDVDSPFDVPFSERTREEQEQVYDLVASRLADIASNYGREDSRPNSPEGATAPVDVPTNPSDTSRPVSSVERDIAGILRGAADKHMDATYNSQISEMMLESVKKAGYSKFKKELKRQMNSEPDLQQLALLFDVTKGAVQLAGAGGQLAVKVKEFSLRYFEDKFAGWIIGRGGWDSMLSDEDATGGEDQDDVMSF